MGKIGQARGFLFFRIVNKFFFRKRKNNKKGVFMLIGLAGFSITSKQYPNKEQNQP